MIDQFRGKFYFLSNFFAHELDYQGVHYLNNEAAFQASKVIDIQQRRHFSMLPPNEAKRLGRHVTLRPDWDTYRLQVMREILEIKFSDPILADKLKATGTQKLAEGNNWHDVYWGFDLKTGRGQNHLGKLLMEIRSTLK